jgi:peptide/nickel transport system substrate-binding protein
MVLTACTTTEATPETITVVETVVVPGEETVTEVEVVVTATPVPVVEEPRTLVICLGQEPDALYPYGTDMLASSQIQEAVWDGPVDTRSFAYQPVIIEKLASLADGDAVINTVDVVAGDKVVGDDGEVHELAAGVKVRPAGCSATECAVEWDGTAALQMEQMVVTTKLLPGLTFSDGTPLTSADQISASSCPATRTSMSASMPSTALLPTKLPMTSPPCGPAFPATRTPPTS